MMKKTFCLIFLTTLFAGFVTASDRSDSFPPFVDESGNITVPSNYQFDWAYLGTWAVASKEEGGGIAEFHNVYTQPATIAAYKKTGKFPDGAVLIKELLQTGTDTLTTGKVSWGTNIKGWFVMVKDAEGRYPKNPLWGDGWGWALFNADAPTATVTKDYKTDCIPCHLPAKKNDWVYIDGYPPLR
jgi:hypothetical protein